MKRINYWQRTCTRCGFTETLDYEPEELVNERNENKKKARIRKLEKMLEDLKNE